MQDPSSLRNPVDHDLEPKGRAVLAAGVVAGPPAGPYAPGVAYPLALDVDADVATISFAALELHPDIAAGWWCVAVTFRLRDGRWYGAGDHDNTTSPEPFVRPERAADHQDGWADWQSNGPLVHNDGWNHGYFGIAPRTTARLVVTTQTGRTRQLPITPWNGAYATTVSGQMSTLSGYDARGNLVGSRVIDCRGCA